MLDLTQHWYQKKITWLSLCLWPLSQLFRLIAWLRRTAYQLGWLKSKKVSVPVIVMGNITVGGTGKTPFTIWLAQRLIAEGFRPGIVSRGYGGAKQQQPILVSGDELVSEVGDEALLLAAGSGCPVAICAQRCLAAELLLTSQQCDLILADDGLQHYALQRDIEIALIDESRKFGNGLLLPAGPLREPVARLKQVDFQVIHGPGGDMQLQPIAFINVKTNASVSITAFKSQKIAAVAAIGHPQRFFDTLRDLHFDLITKSFPDHYLYQQQDFDFAQGLPIIMTEKDAIKCRNFAADNWWYLKVAAKIETRLEQQIINKIINIGVNQHVFRETQHPHRST